MAVFPPSLPLFEVASSETEKIGIIAHKSIILCNFAAFEL